MRSGRSQPQAVAISLRKAGLARKNPLSSRGNWIAGGLVVGGVAATVGGTALFAGNFLCGFMSSDKSNCSGADAKSAVGAALMVGGVVSTGAGIGGFVGGHWDRPILGGAIGAVSLPLLIALVGRLNGGTSQPPAKPAP